jgi:hypothetical protein
MKNIFLLRPDFDGFEILIEKQPELETIRKFNGQPIDGWRPLELYIEKEKHRKKSDYPIYSSHIPVFSRNAIDYVGILLERYGQILPVTCNDGEYFAYNVSSVIDALDEEKSEILRFESGRIMCIRKYVFKKHLIENVPIFKQRGSELQDVFVTDVFTDLVKKNNLKGFSFSQVDVV